MLAVPISFEFFPPKTPEGADRLRAARRALYATRPEFCSVTYGAGGSTQQGTFDTVREILAEGVAAAPHLSCIGTTKADVRAQLEAFRAAGIRRIVALRGDLPSGWGLTQNDFRYASDLVAFIRAESGDHFAIEVAAYPEMHPQARSPQADLEAFATKVRAGASGAITQFFFNPEAYWRFVEDATRLGVDVPIVAGIMPITNSTQILRFADANGSDVPRWIRLRLMSFGDDSASIRAFGIDVVSALCRRLLDAGAPGLHFYTLNQAALTTAIWQRLEL